MKPSQLSSKWSILVLCTLVSCVYLIRSSTSGSTKRSLQAAVAQSTMCVGVDTSEAFTQREIDRSNAIDTYLNQVRGGNQLLDDLNSADTEDQFLHEYLHSLLPFIVIGLVLTFLSCVCLYCHCYNYNCFRTCSNPTKVNKIIWMGFAFLFSLAMVALAATGLYFGGGMNTGYLKGTCSLSEFIVEFSAGNSSMQWIGLAPAVDTITNVTNNIDQTINGLPNPGSAQTNAETYYNQTLLQIGYYYGNSSGQTVIDPTNSTLTITPDFIANLGPPSNNATFSGAIYTEVQSKYSVIGALQMLSPALDFLQQNGQSINNTLNEGVSFASDLNSKLNTILGDYENYAQTGKKVNNAVSIAIMVFFIVAIILSAIILLGVINSFTLKFRWAYKFMVFIRYFLNIILILSALVLAVAWPASVAAMETCNGMKQLTTDDSVFNETFNGTIIELVSTCFYGDGDLLGAFGINYILGNLSAVFQSNETLVQYLTIPDSIVIPAQQQAILNYKNGEAPVTASITTDLNTLNSYTDTTPSCSQDTWVLNSINCTSNMGTVFNSTSATDNFGSPTCIGFNHFSFPGTDRYHSTSCVNANAATLVNGFETHVQQVNTTFGQLQTDLNSVSSVNSQFMTTVQDVITPLAQVGDTINDILQTVGNSQTGLIANMNCTFIRTNTQNVVDDICIGYLPIIFETCIYLFVWILVTIFGLFPIFFAGKIQMQEVERHNKSLDDSSNQRYLMDGSSEEKTSMELANMKL